MSSRGSLQNNTGIVSGFGKTDNYQTVLPDIRGRLRKLSDYGKMVEQSSLTTKARWEWVVRYDSELIRKIDKTTRWVIDGTTYWVESWEQVNMKKFYLRFILHG